MKKNELRPTNQFKKDLRLAKKRGYNLKRLESVIDILAEGQPLDAKYRDHELIGDYAGFRECHIQPDWLLIYQYENSELYLILSRTGTHSDLF